MKPKKTLIIYAVRVLACISIFICFCATNPAVVSSDQGYTTLRQTNYGQVSGIEDTAMYEDFITPYTLTRTFSIRAPPA